MKPTEVQAILVNVPRQTGVYTWRGLRGRVLYIGKAIDLRSRLSAYPKTTDARIIAMVNEARTLVWETTATEIEALILEAHRIKQQKPKYNIVMRDDKQYSYVGITDEPFPRPIVTHQAQPKRGGAPYAKLIGPFTDAPALHTTVRWLRTLLPYCTCKQTHHLRCLNAHIGKCPGYCCLKAPATASQRAEYRRTIRAISDILEGRRDALIRRLETRMRASGKAGNLDEALSLQRLAARIRHVFENAQLVNKRRRLTGQHAGALDQLVASLGLPAAPRRIEGYDMAQMQGSAPTGSLVVFTDGQADSSAYRLFNISTAVGGDTAMLKEMLTRRLRHSEWPFPDLILIDGGKAQLNEAVRVLARHTLSIPVIALTKDDRHRPSHLHSSLDSEIRMLNDTPRPMRNLVEHIDAEAHRFAITQFRRRSRTLRKRP